MPIGKKGLYNNRGPTMRRGNPMDSVRGPLNKGKDFFNKAKSHVFGYAKGMSMQGARENWRMVGRGTTSTLVTAGRITKRIGGKAASAARLTAKIASSAYKKVSRMPGPLKVGGLAVGAIAMMGIGMMRGAMDQSRNIVHERYLQDMTYSRSMINQSRVGLAHGTSQMLNRGGTQGLSNALSRTRHGRY